MLELLSLGRVTLQNRTSVGESEVVLPMHIKFPLFLDCGHCIIKMGRLQRGTESDDAGITVFRSGDPQNMTSIGESGVPVPMHLKF